MDIVPILLQTFLVVFLIAMNGFFVAAEFCCVKMRPSRLETLIQEGNTRAKYAKKLIDELDEALSVTQLGITLASLGLGWVGEPFVAELIAPLIHALGVGETLGHTISFALAFSLITSMHIILGELTPKSMAIAASEKILLNIALPMIVFWKVMYPFVWLLNTTASFVGRHLGLTEVGEGEMAHNPEEIRLLMKESRKQGLVDDTEVDFVDNVFDFTERNVREIMVPRPDMVCLYLDKSYEENLATILEEEMTRYPICLEDKDHIVGFLHIKDLTKILLQGKKKPSLKKLARKVFFVPESMDVSVLLKTMQTNRSQLAIVVDEYGGTAGMVTIEDIIEEIVGDIQDEFDEERPDAEKRDENLYSIDAKMLLEELEDSYVKRELRVPVNGVFFAKTGEVCTLEVSSFGEKLLLPVAFPKQERELVSVLCEGFVCEKAGKLPATEEAVRKQLSKTGNEPFYFEELKVSLADDVFLPNGLLNELRRNALAKLAEAILTRFERNKNGCSSVTKDTLKEDAGPEVAENCIKDKTFLDCMVSTKQQAEAVGKEPQVRRIYLDFQGQSISEVSAYAGKLRETGKEVWFCFPGICRKETIAFLREEFPRIRKNFDGYLVRNYEILSVLTELDEAWQDRCVLDATMYVMNRQAKAFYRKLFCAREGVLTAPYELSAKELRELGVEDMTLVVYGRIPLMTSVHCIKKTMGLCRNGKGTEGAEVSVPVILTDRVGKKLPVRQNCRECYNVIYNPECLSLLDGTGAVDTLSPYAIRLDFTFETKEETECILKSATGTGKPVTGTGYTRGHFKRGVE